MSLAIIVLLLRRRYQRENPRFLRRSLRDEHNPYTNSTERLFIDLYRFPKAVCINLIEEIKPFLKKRTRAHAIASHLKVLCALRFFATGSFQRAVGQDHLSSMSQTSVSRCVTEVAIAINKIAHRHVKFPTRGEFAQKKIAFFEKHNFPGVIGLIDGTHVKICAPKKEIEHVYYCRKGGHSKNVQIICDADYVILSASARFGGTANDAYIWRSSKVNRTLEEHYNGGEREFWLLGDSGYPLQPWLMTPIGAPSSSVEEAYNISHKKTRSLVERCIGILKSRFRCLSKERALFYSSQKAGIIIYACIVLHNVLIKARVPFTDMLEEPETSSNREEDATVVQLNNILSEGRRQRTRLIEGSFS